MPNVDATDSFTDFDSVHTQVDYNKILSNSSFYPSDSDASRSSSKAHMSYLDESASAVPEVSVNRSAENDLRLVSTSVDSSNNALGSWFYNPVGLKNDVHVDSQIGKKKISESKSQHLDQDNAPWHTSTVLEDSSINIRRSGEDHPFPTTSYGGTSARSRPSFLDAIGISRDSSTSHWMHHENMNANPPISFNDTKLHSVDIPLSSNLKPLTNINGPQHPFSSSNSDLANEQLNSFDSSNDVQMLERSSEHLQKKHELLIPKKDETFSALEQHIEDLTQEKFALQRALDTSRTVAESLATENSSLTESYNQQAKLVIELRSDIERLREEVKDQLGAVESLKLEYANAQLECNAADERAKILAAEVIGLEEKALRLRSNELKLEKQIEGLSSETASYKRKLSSLEKERQDFQSTINAMQEEKKLLQSKLRKVPTNSPNHDNMKVYLKKDMATSTEDLVDDVDVDTNVTETMVRGTMTALLNSMPSRDLITNIPEERTLSVSDSSIGIPHEQLRMIDNINSLLSELAMEKEELMQTLTIETSNNSKLKDLNKELSRKLEAQTQRLELLTAQRMANENTLTRTTDIHNTTDTMEYADEGDEVVERVLGWIMKLFPGVSRRAHQQASVNTKEPQMHDPRSSLWIK
ncbi:hypothetical protein HPP92_013733 [Vanilla planifolia]|uniref:Uncharacterized protein n=1 Tax=Vanilla planifolia TaxID=51239 RepID=A0A835QUL5_VANPL|nr:hypothetical protein HPP92_026454 [Vanilla planifolia]KAG0479014.1 hypothetical protein HPP92_013733 [Vanilla planifolia]